MALPTTFDTTAFEVAPRFDADGVITAESLDEIRAVMDDNGFVILPGFLTPDEVETGRGLQDGTIVDVAGETSQFASETDIHYRRRDFHAIPWTDTTHRFLSSVLGRTGDLLRPYMDDDAALLECSAMISYPGSSHQYLHRDPDGAISVFLVLDDVDRKRGGTVFVPGSHRDDSTDVYVYARMINAVVFAHNLVKLVKMRLGRGPEPGPGEIRSRLWSRLADRHQPNLLGFLTGKNIYMSIRDFFPDRLFRLVTRGPRAWRSYQLVGTAPDTGTVIVWHSRIFHAGPDNVSDGARMIMTVSLSRDGFDAYEWREAYQPHSSMVGNPTRVAELAGWTGS